MKFLDELVYEAGEHEQLKLTYSMISDTEAIIDEAPIKYLGEAFGKHFVAVADLNEPEYQGHMIYIEMDVASVIKLFVF